MPLGGRSRFSTQPGWIELPEVQIPDPNTRSAIKSWKKLLSSPLPVNNKKHYAAAIAAFVGWGFFSIPLRALQHYPAGEILYFRILFSALIMLVIVFAFKREDWRKDWSALNALSKPERNKVILLTLAGGVLLSVNWLLRSEEHTSELQSHSDLVCRLLLEKKKKIINHDPNA